ncbi:MAG: hypothetical protein VB080_09035 [Propionicimonas sp.]|uniref:hypothetical protein n=1 Tax=Propionicimonas sp. TaxID=1955623 RepID=UPI002B1F5384|nr:hypothetical protein [Propionicimonas sp.]MEA4944567.1 hypothetical protein [Propionicimonas sp.]
MYVPGAVAGSAVALVLLAGCVFDAGKPEVVFENNLSVDVQVHLDGVEHPAVIQVSRDGGTNSLPVRDCRGTGIVVETTDGDLVGRVDKPACVDWRLTVNEDGSLTYQER